MHTPTFERLREAAIDFGLGVVLVESNFVVWWANPAFLALIGFNLEDVQGRDIRDFREDERALYPERMSSFAAEYVDGFGDRVAVTTTVLPVFDGTTWAGNVLLEQPAGEVTGEVEVLRQSLMSTESLLKESKLLYQALYENSTDLIQSTNTRGELMFVNESWRRLLGYSEREATRLTMADVLAPGQDEMLRLFRGEVPPPRERVRLEMRTRSAQRLWVEGTVSYRHVQGRVVGTHAIFADITERERLQRMKDEFVAMVNHELRTPLTSIIGSLNLIVDGVVAVEPDARRFIEIALRNANRLSTLVQEVLDFEKLAAGKLQVEVQPIVLGPFLRELREDYAGFATTRQVEIAVPEASDDVVAQTDPALLRHVVGNFLANAVRFAGADAIVRFGVEAMGSAVRVWVHDRGDGLGIAFRANAFQPFEQDVDISGGTGLGLSIAASMAERLDATVGFVSFTGVGSTFFVDLSADSSVPPVEFRSSALSPADLVLELGRHPRVRLHIEPGDDAERLLLELTTSRAPMTIVVPAEHAERIAADHLVVEVQNDQ